MMPCVTEPVRPNGRADGQHAVADLHGVAVAHVQVRERPLGARADDGQVGAAIALDVLGGELAAVVKLNDDLVGPVDDVVSWSG